MKRQHPYSPKCTCQRCMAVKKLVTKWACKGRPVMLMVGMIDKWFAERRFPNYIK